MLDHWDFADEAANASGVNRQKSATSLVVLSIDRPRESATFFDPKREQTHSATLSECDCHDFSFAGKSPRKAFSPCMHIYRLATELGLFANKYEDPTARYTPGRLAALAAHRAISEMKDAEDNRLRALPRMPSQWGRWNSEIHSSGVQRNRQFRAFFILDDEPDALTVRGASVTVHEYPVTLDGCGCADFADRRLPCKHIYALALSDGVELPVSAVEYNQARLEGKELLFRFENA